MLRGNNKQKIFFDDTCFLKFYELLENSVEQFHCKIHLFCLMTNHAHLVIEIHDIPISKIMHSLEVKYVKYINLKYERVGHLYQGSFNSKIILDEHYLLNLCYYIHNNPLQAKMINRLDDYRWSSHHCYNKSLILPWLTTKYMLNLIQKHFSSSNAEMSYNIFMMDQLKKLNKSDAIKFNDNDELSIQNDIAIKLETNHYDNFSLLSIDEIINVICEIINVEKKQLRSPSQKAEFVLARAITTYFCHYYAGYNLNAIAPYFERKADGLSRVMHKMLKNATSDKLIKSIKCRLQIVQNNKVVVPGTYNHPS